MQSGPAHPLRVSVVVPAYNAAEFITEALDSVALQTCKPIELIVIDDGSKDGTGELTRAWGRAREAGAGFELVVITQMNKGLPATRNVGIARATGDWIAFLDADDIWEPDHVAALAKAVAQVPGAVAAYGGGHLLANGFVDEMSYDEYWDNPSKAFGVAAGDSCLRLGRNALPRLMRGNFIKPSSLMVAASAIAAVGHFDAELRTSEDREFLIRLLMHGDFAYIPQPITRYRWHDDNISHTKNAKRNAENALRALRRIGSKPQVMADDVARSACAAQLRHAVREYLFLCSDAGWTSYVHGLRLIAGELGTGAAVRSIELRDTVRAAIPTHWRGAQHLT